MSASIRPTFLPAICSASARFAATVDLPTPPLPLATARTCFTPGRFSFGAGPGVGMFGGGIEPSVRNAEFGVRNGAAGSVWIPHSELSYGGRPQIPERFQRVNPGPVPVGPGDLVGVVADGGHRHRRGRAGLDLPGR